MGYYQDFKEFLKKRTDAGPEKEEEDFERDVKRACGFLGMISLRRYISPLSVESLMTYTYEDNNPLCYSKIDIDETEENCRKVNKKVRAVYGNISGNFLGENASAVKEFIAWCALFPGKAEELAKAAFPEAAEEDEYSGFEPSGADMIVLKPIVGCRLGDELPLSTAVSAVRASMVSELMKDETENMKERKRLASLILE